MATRSQSLKMKELTKDKRKISERILNHALGIIFLLTGEEYVVVKKGAPHSSIHLLNGEVPIKCGDISVYFSMEEWDYIEGHKDIYKDVIIEGRQVSDATRNPEKTISDAHDDDDDADVVFISEVVKTEKCETNKEEVKISATCAGEYNGDYVYSSENPKAPNMKSHLETEQKETNRDIGTGRSLSIDVQRESQVADCASDLTEEGVTHVTHQLSNSWVRTVEDNSGVSHPPKEESHVQSCSLTQAMGDHTESLKGFHEESWTMPCSSEWTMESGTGAPHGFKEEPHIVGPSLAEAIEDESNACDAFQGTSWSVSCSWDQAESGNTSTSCTYQDALQEYSPNESGSYKSGNLLSLNQCQKNMHLLNERFTRDSSGNIQISKKKPTRQDRNPLYTGQNPHRFDKCGDSFHSTNNLSRLKIYPEENNCEAQLPTASNLSEYTEPVLSYICHVCGKPFSKREQLIIHQRIHTGDKPYECPECGKCFTSRSHVVIHYRTHTGEKPYVCNVCEKSFAKRTNLDRHFRIHTREKPYMCRVCGKCFTRRSNVISHQTTHTGEKPYSCPECGKCFTQRSHMIIHHKIHLGEKPYVCSVCGKRFAKKGYLDLHKRAHRTEKASLF
ncbi:zinc finger 300-like isoform X1 [Pelobates cultripes]|uniref:Zinc finger 300-like isoform X1 n=2 Tax=Pelobates cultripes TaxID=61616 RepID=A0AAD1SY27_PELCU|nr:zinc finger 300-like isoform X1 [Pelobates cultripes]